MLLLWLWIAAAVLPLMNFLDPRFGRPIEPRGVPARPAIVTVCDADGEVAARWYPRAYNVRGWTTGPELLVFLTYTAYGWAYVAGDPLNQSVWWIEARRPYGNYMDTDYPWIFMQREWRPAYRRWPAVLPAPLAQGRAQGEAGAAAGGSRRCGGRLVDGSGEWRADGSMEYSAKLSPSGRWVAVVERQRGNTYVIYETSVDGSGGVRVLGAVGPTERPSWQTEPSEQSPDGQWTVTLGQESVTIESVDGQARVLPLAAFGSGPIWAPDGRRFAFQSSAGIIAADVEGSARLLVAKLATSLLIIGWTEHGLAWLHGTPGLGAHP